MFPSSSNIWGFIQSHTIQCLVHGPAAAGSRVEMHTLGPTPTRSIKTCVLARSPETHTATKSSKGLPWCSEDAWNQGDLTNKRNERGHVIWNRLPFSAYGPCLSYSGACELQSRCGWRGWGAVVTV